MAKAAFKVGDRVVDRDGFKGSISLVTEHEGSRWYDVRFENGSAVRYDSDLSRPSGEGYFISEAGRALLGKVA